MIVSRIRGGLGNQLFMYAAGCLVQKRIGGEYKLDISWFSSWCHRNSKHAHRDFGLDIFEISAGIASNGDIWKFTVPMCYPNFIRGILRKLRCNKNFYEEDKCGWQILNEIRGDCFLKGYWVQPEILEEIRDELRRELVIRNECLDWTEIEHWYRRIVAEPDAVCVHFRRGDFVGTSIGVLPKDYYANALSQIEERLGKRPSLFVFSDDLAWCKENFRPDGWDVNYVENPPAVSHRCQNDLFLMTQCKHFVIPRSTFSFWASWLGTNVSDAEERAKRIVIQPGSIAKHKE